MLLWWKRKKRKRTAKIVKQKKVIKPTDSIRRFAPFYEEREDLKLFHSSDKKSRRKRHESSISR